MSRIREPKLFEAVFHAMSRRLDAGTAPTLMLFPQTPLVRSTDREYVIDKATQMFAPHRVVENIKPRDAASDDHRFSGLAPLGLQRSQMGGLYTSQHTASMTNEILHYASAVKHQSPSNKLPKVTHTHHSAIVGKAILQMETVHTSLMIVDLSRYAAGTSKFLRALEHDAGVRSAMADSRYKNGSLENALLADGDYTVGRAIGLAVASDYRMSGLRAGTARPSNRPGETGDNVVLYAPNGVPIRNVHVERVTLFEYDPKSGEFLAKDHEV